MGTSSKLSVGLVFYWMALNRIVCVENSMLLRSQFVLVLTETECGSDLVLASLHIAYLWCCLSLIIMSINKLTLEVDLCHVFLIMYRKLYPYCFFFSLLFLLLLYLLYLIGLCSLECTNALLMNTQQPILHLVNISLSKAGNSAWILFMFGVTKKRQSSIIAQVPDTFCLNQERI